MEGAIVEGLGNGNDVHMDPAAIAAGKPEVTYGQNLPGNPLMFAPLFGTSVVVTGVDQLGSKDAAESLVTANAVVIVKLAAAKSQRKGGTGISGCTVASRLQLLMGEYYDLHSRVSYGNLTDPQVNRILGSYQR